MKVWLQAADASEAVEAPEALQRMQEAFKLDEDHMKTISTWPDSDLGASNDA